MDSHPDSLATSRIWSAAKWTIAIPLLLCGVFALAVGIRYFVGKGRLDRLQPLRDDTLTLQFEQEVPDWTRDWLGNRCEPLERICGVELISANDESLRRVLPNVPDTESVDLWFDEDAEITSAGLSGLAKLPRLKRLAIDGDVGHLDLSWLQECRQLESLSFSIMTSTTGLKRHDKCRGWSKLLTGLSNLRELTIYVDDPSLEEWTTLASIPSLHKVGLNWPARDPDEDDSKKSWSISCRSLNAERLSALAAIPNLQHLDLTCEDLSSNVTDGLVHFNTLRSLTLRHSMLTDSMLRGIAKCPRLESLTLVNTPISPLEGLAMLAECPSLNQLIVQENEIVSDHLAGIARITQLRSLRIDHLSDSLQGLTQLTSLTKLEELDLQSDEPIDDIIEAIPSMPELHWLRFKSLPKPDHPLQAKLAKGTIPSSLAGETETAIREMELQLRIDKTKPPEPTEYSIGERRLLPPDPQRIGFVCFF